MTGAFSTKFMCLEAKLNVSRMKNSITPEDCAVQG